MNDISKLKLGKQPAKHDPRTLKLGNYIVGIPATPSSVSWLYKPEHEFPFTWRMFKNDIIGCCAIAGPAHIEMIWTHNASETPFDPTDDQVVSEYSLISGYDPKDPYTDNGCVLIQVMNAWRNNGLFGRKILGYASINPQNIEHIKTAIHLFGAINIGLLLPASAQNQNDIWDVTDHSLSGDAAPGSWGGHCVVIGAYDSAQKQFTCITWGNHKTMTWDFFKAYCDEAYAMVSPDWITATGVAPSGVDIAALQADIKSLS
jgi:hypothetical protein